MATTDADKATVIQSLFNLHLLYKKKKKKRKKNKRGWGGATLIVLSVLCLFLAYVNFVPMSAVYIEVVRTQMAGISQR